LRERSISNKKKKGVSIKLSPPAFILPIANTNISSVDDLLLGEEESMKKIPINKTKSKAVNLVTRNYYSSLIEDSDGEKLHLEPSALKLLN
jgi:hypothetical protein